MTADNSPPNARTFDLAAAIADRERAGEAWQEFFRVPALSMGIYHILAGTDDRASHTPHADDEVYYAVSGSGLLRVGDESFDVHAGTIHYVKAGQEHFFTNVQEDLTLLVVFATAGGEVS